MNGQELIVEGAGAPALGLDTVTCSGILKKNRIHANVKRYGLGMT
jgi:hypothetical protein